ncbi:MAG TPA: gas vesicle protein [Enteractinococcus helveticum]|uniref:Gas vesicle protein n=1 Tax=Enteractinococcus helveticum TaxID=1837282 RepID=A0A921FNV0_9MICC|nr:gas vesicle protein GvpO [Enteractinococcus helveticum]HJF14387.1 gas vesicle protein [Enteractinococcus helveticum]
MTEQQKATTTSSSSSGTSRRIKSAAKESSNRETATKKQPQSQSSETAHKRRPKPKIAANKAVVAAMKQLQMLTTRTPESVVGVTPHRTGWRVTIEVVESARIPDSADIMAEYEVDIDGSGELDAYWRKSRYFRGRPQAE